jgi:hypothetical protein
MSPAANAKTNHATTYDMYSNPFHDSPCKIVRMNVFLGYHIAVYANACSSNFVLIPGDERMPFIKGTTLVY